MSSLAPQDELRLHVLLSSNPQAIRIDEARMCVLGLSGSRETVIELNPTSSDRIYLRLVREALSEQVLGMPGGYPALMSRWNSMEKPCHSRVDRLLRLGDPDAVAAATNATDLTDEQARCAWWASPSEDNARTMLTHCAVKEGATGAILAQHLLEFLPFETDSSTVTKTVSLLLQPGLLPNQDRDTLWHRAQRQTSYLLGFLVASSDSLPGTSGARFDRGRWSPSLKQLAADGNGYASLMSLLLDTTGQRTLVAFRRVLAKPADQEAILLLISTIADYFSQARSRFGSAAGLETACRIADSMVDAESADPACRAFLLAAPLRRELRAMIILAMANGEFVRPILAKTTAVGPLLRRKLDPVASLLDRELAILLGEQ